MTSVRLTFLLLLPLPGYCVAPAQQREESPLQAVMRVADKVLRETTFEVELQQGEGKQVMLKAAIPPEASFQAHSYFEWHYANGQMALAVIPLADATKEARYREFIERYCSTTLDTYDSCKYQYEVLNARKVFNYRIFRKAMLDNTSAAVLPFVERALRDELPRARYLVDEMADYVRYRQSRLADSTLCRPDPEERTVWADDLFMSVPFLVRYAKLTGDETCYDDAANQVIKFHKYLFDKDKGLASHCWFDREKKNGVAFWGRANGWMMWAMVEALLHLPQSHREYRTVLSIFREHAKGLVRYQNQRGMWHQVLNRPDSYEETSCTAMFTLAIARGIRNGWIDKSYQEKALRGWNAVKAHIADDGTVSGICQGTAIGETLEYYFTRKTPPHDPRGLGAVITAGIEVKYLLEWQKH